MRANKKSKSERYTAFAFSFIVCHRGGVNETPEPKDLLSFLIDVGLPCGNWLDYPCLVKRYQLQCWLEAKSSTFAITIHKGRMPSDYQKQLFEVSQTYTKNKMPCAKRHTERQVLKSMKVNEIENVPRLDVNAVQQIDNWLSNMRKSVWR